MIFPCRLLLRFRDMMVVPPSSKVMKSQLLLLSSPRIGNSQTWGVTYLKTNLFYFLSSRSIRKTLYSFVYMVLKEMISSWFFKNLCETLFWLKNMSASPISRWFYQLRRIYGISSLFTGLFSSNSIKNTPLTLFNLFASMKNFPLALMQAFTLLTLNE